MRADRLLSILLLLQTHGQMTTRELAERMEVSERTIHRDMEALGTAGVPVVAERGSRGGWGLLENYRTNLTGLNNAELQALLLTTPAQLLNDLGLRQAYEGALIKLLASIPSMQRRDAEYFRQRVYIDGAGWLQKNEDMACFPVIQEAVWQERKLRLTYQRGHGTPVERLVDPLGLVAKGSVWYLIASIEQEMRTYRIARIESVIMTDEPFARPADFDLAAYWAQSMREFKANLPRYPTVLRVAPEILARVLGGGLYMQVESTHVVDVEGWTKVHIQFDVEEQARSYVLGWGDRLEVLEPPELREQVIAYAEKVVRFYREGASTGQQVRIASE
jgi:predicted DNA-binding transcriptional regulator YafY